MAKTNNLTDFLTDVADAIREKEGSSAPINPQDFSAKIRAIQGGGESGGGGVIIDNDVNFIDSDGSLLYSYAKNDFLALAEMPIVPEKEGFTSQGWNWSFDDAKAFVRKYGVIDIGATYITDDGNTRLYITIDSELKKGVAVCFEQTVSRGVTVDWGDGSATETISNTGEKQFIHTYANIGDYVITLKVTSGKLSLGWDSMNYCVLGSTSSQGTSDMARLSMLRKVAIGKNCNAIGYAFYYMPRLECVIIPKEVTILNNNVLYSAFALGGLVIPRGVTSTGNYALYYLHGLRRISIPNSVNSMALGLGYAYNLRRLIYPDSITQVPKYSHNSLQCPIIIPDSITSFADNALYQSYAHKIHIPDTVTTLGSAAFNKCYYWNDYVELPNEITTVPSNCFQYCSAVTAFKMPQKLASIGAYAFAYCAGVTYFDFSETEQVPSLANYNAFTNSSTSVKFIIPDALFDEWKAATNWSTWASKMVKASEFNA